jgi:hypothetical protein
MKGSELRKLAKNMPVFIVEISLIIVFLLLPKMKFEK